MDIGAQKEQKVVSNASFTQKMKILQDIDNLMSQMNSQYNEGMFALSSIHFRNSESQYSLNPNAYQVGPAKRHVKIDQNKLNTANNQKFLQDIYQLSDNIEHEYKFQCDSDDEDDLLYLKNSKMTAKEEQEIIKNQEKMKQFLDDLLKNKNSNSKENQPTEQLTKRTNKKKEQKQQNQQQKDEKNEKAEKENEEEKVKQAKKIEKKEQEIQKKKILNQMLRTDEQIISAFGFQSKVFGIEAAQFQFKQFLDTALKLASYLTIINEKKNQQFENNN